MVKLTKPKGPDVAAPDRSVDVPDPPSHYDSMQVLQSLIEIQKELTANSTKTDRLINDVSGLINKVDSLGITWAWARGFAVAAFILIPICAGIVWWLIGDQLSAIRDQILRAMPDQAVTRPAAPPTADQPELSNSN